MSLPKLPEICSYVQEEPVVCCTDCTLSYVDAFRDSAVAPYGVLISRRGPKAWKKCVEYFHKLPYPCRGKGDVLLQKSLEQFRLCYISTLKVTLNLGRLTTQSWKFPHLALLGYGEKVSKAQWLCEGTVISERFILTAARCTEAGGLGTVRYASLGVQSNEKHKNTNIYKIKKIFIHPKYNEPSWYHDIALLQTEQEFRDSAVAPYGVLISRRGPKAWKKCVEYFHKLPYPCRGKGDVLLQKSLEQFRLCYISTLKVTLNLGRLTTQSWKFPHLALLGYGEKVSKAQWLCEGTVISERFILTAARCTEAGGLGTVRYASLGVQSNEKHKNTNIYKIKKIFIHPKYNEPSWYHDIALLQTEQEYDFLIYLLHLVYLDKMSRLKCKIKYRPNNNLQHGFDGYKQLCYEEHDQTGKSCKRLSGSPLQVNQFRCQYTAVGVTGEVVPCGTSRVPDIFTRVFTHVPWIESIVWPDED
uniref:Peptidase S1 domain-containing protein n=1 Tax=Heliothis virescens TaxID=7102 RepID=A0A2A4KAX4_HELVI